MKTIKENQFNFDRYEWKDGSITGKGLSQMLNDTTRWNSMENAVKIYDRNNNMWYDIIDAHIDQNNLGLVLEIDTDKESTGKKNLVNNTNKGIDMSNINEARPGYMDPDH